MLTAKNGEEVCGLTIFKQRFILCFLSLICILQSQTAFAMEGRPYFEFGMGYRTGDFGTSITSSLYDASSTAGYIASDYDFGVTAPFLFLTNESDDQADHQNGIGDIIARAGLVLVREKDKGFSLYGDLSVKIPTANSDKGLGTGETDYGALLILSRSFETVKLSVMGGYFIVGDTPVQDYNNLHLYGIGVSKIFDRTGLTVYFEGRRSLIPGSQDPKNINFGIFHVINANYSIRGNILYGLNDGGPDYGFNFGLSRWF
ncbi:MAG: transporter [Desulfobacterales bacterium]